MLSIIVAVADNNAIGCHNKLIWHISEDLQRFKRLTTSHTVIMGRKTFESIGRALPNRHNIVITHDANLKIEGVTVVNSIESAIEAVSADETETFIIGGGEIYHQTLPMAQKLYLTRVHECPDADAFFPEIDAKEWREISREDAEKYSFIDYIRA